MTFRITLLIPIILVVSTLASSVLVYTNAKRQAETNIRKEVVAQIKLDIARLQNVLYNRLTEKASNIEEARLNLSVTAMDPMIRSLLLTDEYNRIIVANRYLQEGNMATRMVEWFDQSIAQQVKRTNTLTLNYLPDNDTLLQGYFPVVLHLESEQGIPTKRVGILYVEVSIAHKLAAAFSNAANQSLYFAGFMLAVSLLVAWLLHQLISKRLNRLSEAAAQLAAGNLDARTALSGKDELGKLGHAFDDMAARIKSDIQRRQQAKEDLRVLNETLEERVSERTQQLQEAQRIGHMGNWSWDVTSNQLYWSDEIYRIFGYKPGEIEPTYDRFIATLHPDDVARIKQSEQQAFSQGKRHSIDHRIILSTGEERWVHEEAIATLDENGKPVSLTGTVQDITERKLTEQNLRQAKEEAEQASKAKSVFLSRMSHELRTPLNAILGFSQILQMEAITTEQQNFVDEIRQAGNHLLALISELLDLSRIEAGRLLVVMESINLKEVVDEATNLTRGLMEKNQLQLHWNYSGDYNVIADKIRLRQVLVNILSNAAKYNKKGGLISVECESCDDTVKISVIDSGVGIKPEHMQKLFTPFERMDAEYSGVDGTGIGLALSKQIIELMNGSIGVDSNQGVGSTFWIELQTTKPPSQNEEEAIHELTELNSRCHVLYIEDNVSNLRVVEAMLRHHPKLKLMSANNGSFGLELAQEYRPDVVLLDIHLPDMNGYDVLQALRQNVMTGRIPVIALSADAMPIDVEQGLAAGFDDYLTKPVDAEKLFSVLAKYSIATKQPIAN
ncbi:MAG: ATP-binding protein [Gammaproteobacteria bacterium]|jgi:PAS domain S-box-containing protein